MCVSLPRFELYTSPSGDHHSSHKSLKRWSFRLVAGDGQPHFEATDFEADVTIERLSLLAVVRGLEWLDQPSQVTLVGPSRCVSRGLRYGLDMWRDCSWCWERFGQMMPVRNADLWQRIDVALAFHRLNCQTIRTDVPHSGPRAPHFARARRRRRGKLLETA
jgi:ribonuclease HI